MDVASQATQGDSIGVPLAAKKNRIGTAFTPEKNYSRALWSIFSTG